jgi:methylenetetrahydrofolate dehydrogenase (NADP+) / methenyltetrahydrofolate cyclohydrolase
MGLTNVHGVPGWQSARRPRAEIIDGKAVAAKVRAAVARDISELVEETGRAPGLATILVGDDPPSAMYVANKQKACRDVGIRPFHYELPADASMDDVRALIARLNENDDVSGVLCQLPVPDHLDGVQLTGLIAPEKDVDGLTQASAGSIMLGRDGLRPCTPAGVMVLLEEADVTLEGAHALVIGRSNLFGKPMAQLLLAANATVTMAHSRTRDLPAVCRSADVLIAAVGRDRMVKGDWIAPGAVVIDVGINRAHDGLHGDVDFAQALERAAAITPVPGGVGPMTIAMLLRNTLTAAKRSHATA